MSSGSRKIWIAGTIENRKVLIGRRGVVESRVGA
jgi:hypothetical protein